jgi:hypothetical protein
VKHRRRRLFIVGLVRSTWCKEGRSSFLKKRSKKLLPIRHVAHEQKFFGSFFQKRTASFLIGSVDQSSS